MDSYINNPKQIIHNPYSFRWKSGKRLDEFKSAVENADLNYDLIHTEFSKHGVELGKQVASESYDLIVAAGGDGTISDVINGIVLGCTDNKLPKNHSTWLKVKTTPDNAVYVSGEIFSRSIDQVEYRSILGIVPMLVNND